MKKELTSKNFLTPFGILVLAWLMATGVVFVSCNPETEPLPIDVKAGDTTQLFVRVWDTTIGQTPVMHPWTASIWILTTMA